MTARTNETIGIDQLSIGYAGKDSPHIVANRIHTALLSGELTCLLGANGAGKSTLLRTLSGFIPPISGNILLNGRDLSLCTRTEMAQQISVVLTDKLDINDMTVRDMVALGRTPYTNFWGKMSDKDSAIVDQAMECVNISSLAKRRIQNLSDGERQKTMIAKALAQETPIILLDEPTAFLDFPSKVEVMQLLKRLSHEMDKSILLSTHDMELALQIADKVWLMEKGKMLITGTPEDLSLDGILTHFFHRKGIVFDEHTGLFNVDYQIHSYVHIVGQCLRADMVRKALLRNGIASGDEQSDICVNVTDDAFIIRQNNKASVTVSTIDALVNEMKMLLPS